jgi:ABC-2 type transport system permease protein
VTSDGEATTAGAGGRRAGGRAASRPAPLGRSIAALASMELRLALRRGENLLVMVVIPVAVLLFFGGSGIVPLATPGAAVAFLLPGSMALAIIATSLVNLGIATAYERSYGVLKRLGGSPLPRSGLIAAKIATVLAIEVVQVVILVVAATLALGWAPAAGENPVGAVALVAVGVALGTLAFAGLGLLMAGTLRAEATLALANALFLGFLMLGGIVLPLDHLPSWLGALASVLPASALADVFRSALGDATGSGSSLAADLGILVAWGLATTGLAARRFRWD